MSVRISAPPAARIDELLVAAEDRDRRVGELLRPPLDVEHRVVADHRPERLVARLLDPVDRAAGVELDGLAPPRVEIAVAVRVGEQIGHGAPLVSTRPRCRRSTAASVLVQCVSDGLMSDSSCT